MRVMAAVLLATAFAAPVSADVSIDVPSGQAVTFVETIDEGEDQGTATVRYRFLAPAIGEGGGIDADAALEDMAHLCDTFALPQLMQTGPLPQAVVISLSDRPVDFGATDTEAVQYFEAFTVEDGACVWELY